MYVCKSCLKTWKKNKSYCTDKTCGGEVIELDELMLAPITMLWAKGYETGYCCSGHPEDECSRTYIKFEIGIDVPNIPAGFTKSISTWDGSVVVETHFDTNLTTTGELSLIERQKAMLRSMNSLTEWVEELPIVKIKNY
jgi:hypothetical protein